MTDNIENRSIHYKDIKSEGAHTLCGEEHNHNSLLYSDGRSIPVTKEPTPGCIWEGSLESCNKTDEVLNLND